MHLSLIAVINAQVVFKLALLIDSSTISLMTIGEELGGAHGVEAEGWVETGPGGA